MFNNQMTEWLRGGLLWAGTAALLLSAGCVMSPPGAKGENERVQRIGRKYERLPWARSLPDLPEHPDRQAVVERAMLADGNLEAAYFRWAAAMQRVVQAGTWPSTNLSLGLSYMLGTGGSTWNRTTVQLSPDMMRNLDWPAEISTAAQQALQQARAAGAEYAEQRRQVWRQAVEAWLDYTLTAEEIRLQTQDMDLLKLAEQSARAAVSAGGDQQALLNAQIARAQGHERLHELESTLESRRAGLNAMLHRPVEAALPPPTRLPSATPIHLNDAQVLALAALRDPKLKVLVHTVAGRSKAIDLTKLQSLPDLNPEFAFTGSISRMIGAGLSIPQVRLPAIQAMVREAHDQWRAAIGQLEQAQYDQAAQVVTALVMIRHHQHNERLFSRTVLPAARRIIASLQQEYVAGTIPQAKLIEAQRMVLAVQRTIAEARIGREKWLASLEAIMGKLPEKNESQENNR